MVNDRAGRVHPCHMSSDQFPQKLASHSFSQHLLNIFFFLNLVFIGLLHFLFVLSGS